MCQKVQLTLKCLIIFESKKFGREEFFEKYFFLLMITEGLKNTIDIKYLNVILLIKRNHNFNLVIFCAWKSYIFLKIVNLDLEYGVYSVRYT